MDPWKTLSAELIAKILSHLYQEVVVDVNFERYVQLQKTSRTFYPHVVKLFKHDLMVSQAAICNTSPSMLFLTPCALRNPMVKLDITELLERNEELHFWNWKNLDTKLKYVLFICRALEEYIRRNASTMKKMGGCLVVFDRKETFFNHVDFCLLNDPKYIEVIFAKRVHVRNDLIVALDVREFGLATLSMNTYESVCHWMAVKYKGALMMFDFDAVEITNEHGYSRESCELQPYDTFIVI
jgi:hypothetical protein